MTSTEEKLANLTNLTLTSYLELMAGTETPAIMDTWGIISAASACLTRRKWFPLGSIKIYPNQYIMLVGPPGIRKSAAVGYAKSLLASIEDLRFGPNTTAGRAQGLISAMQGFNSSEAEDAAADAAIGSALSSVNFGFDGSMLGTNHALNRSALYCAESELVGFLGQKMDEFITFLGDMWDCPASHTTGLKRERTEIHFPCLNIIGGITPMHITSYLPAQAIGQGFTSRTLLVYEDRGAKVAWPEPIDEDRLNEFRQLMLWIYNTPEGAFGYTPEVRRVVEELYTYTPAIEDIRFLHYGMRRQSHLLKVAMALCALRMDDTITADDVRDAHEILVITEKRMPEALGEYGMTPAAVAKSRVIEVLKNAMEPMTALRIAMACGSDVKDLDVQRALFEMVQRSTIVEVYLKDPQGTTRVAYAWPRESNPFKKFAEIDVEYLLDERKIKSTARESAAPARPKQKGIDAELLASYEPPAPTDAEGNVLQSLETQGFSSLKDKLGSLLAKRDNT